MKDKKTTILRKTELMGKRNALCHRIDGWISIQELYMPETRQLRASAGDSGHAYAEEEKLWLPSQLPLSLRTSPRMVPLLQKELRLRLGEADDALHEIRRFLRISSTILEFKKGQHVASQRITTKTRQLVLNFRAKTAAVVDRYKAVYAALTELDPSGDWTSTYKPLNIATDLQMPRREEDDPSPENRRELSWIWLVPRSADALRQTATADEVSECK